MDIQSTASQEDIPKVETTPQGDAVRWDALDLDFSIPGLVAGVFGTGTWMAELGRKGGSAQSDAKATAARTNGRKGGRPPKAKAAGVSSVSGIQTVQLQPDYEFSYDSVVIGTSHIELAELVKYEEGLTTVQIRYRSVVPNGYDRVFPRIFSEYRSGKLRGTYFPSDTHRGGNRQCRTRPCSLRTIC